MRFLYENALLAPGAPLTYFFFFSWNHTREPHDRDGRHLYLRSTLWRNRAVSWSCCTRRRTCIQSRSTRARASLDPRLHSPSFEMLRNARTETSASKDGVGRVLSLACVARGRSARARRARGARITRTAAEGKKSPDSRSRTARLRRRHSASIRCSCAPRPVLATASLLATRDPSGRGH